MRIRLSIKESWIFWQVRNNLGVRGVPSQGVTVRRGLNYICDTEGLPHGGWGKQKWGMNNMRKQTSLASWV